MQSAQQAYERATPPPQRQAYPRTGIDQPGAGIGFDVLRYLAPGILSAGAGKTASSLGSMTTGQEAHDVGFANPASADWVNVLRAILLSRDQTLGR